MIAESDGTIDFAGAVGSSVPLASLTTEGYSNAITGLVEIGAPINTAGAQTYNQPIQLDSTSLISEGVNVVAGTYALQFGAEQGESTAAQSLQISLTGSPSDSITPVASGFSTYNAPLAAFVAGTDTLSIVSNPTNSGNSILLQDISFQSVQTVQMLDQDFAVSSVGSGTWKYAPAGSTWTFTGTGGVSGNWSGITAGNTLAPQGSQVGFVQETGSMSETVGMSAGTYTLDFLAAQRENYNHGGQVLQVLVDGSPVGSSITPAGSSYALYGSADFSVTAGIHTITIEGLDPSGQDNKALVDAVSLQPFTTGQVADPDFSDANVGASDWQYAPADGAWYFQGTAGVTGNSSSIPNVAAPQGNQAAFVQQIGSISQVVSLAAGTYTLQFDAAQAENSSSGGQTLQVSIDGVPIGGSITPAGTNYALVTTATFTASAGTHVISIAGLDPQGGDVTALVDSVAIAVPATQRNNKYSRPSARIPGIDVAEDAATEAR